MSDVGTGVVYAFTLLACPDCSDESWITESNIELIKKCLQQSRDPASIEFCRTHRKRLYKGGNKTYPNFTLDSNGVLYYYATLSARRDKRSGYSKQSERIGESYAYIVIAWALVTRGG